METVKERLLHFLESERISKSEFCRRMGVSQAYVNTMRKSLPEEKVVRMTELFPDLNRDWLLYGEGDMRREAKGAKPGGPAQGDYGEYMVPLLPVQAYAGSLQDYSRGISLRDCEMLPVPVRGADYAIPVTGDSMEPEIHNGSIAVVCKINDRAFIPWGNPMVIDSENGVLIKVVMPSSVSDNNIEARSYNPRYPALQIPKSSIFGLYRIVCYLRQVTTM